MKKHGCCVCARSACFQKTLLSKHFSSSFLPFLEATPDDNPLHVVSDAASDVLDDDWAVGCGDHRCKGRKGKEEWQIRISGKMKEAKDERTYFSKLYLVTSFMKIESFYRFCLCRPNCSVDKRAIFSKVLCCWLCKEQCLFMCIAISLVPPRSAVIFYVSRPSFTN